MLTERNSEDTQREDLASHWIARSISGSMCRFERIALTKWLDEKPDNLRCYNELAVMLHAITTYERDLLSKEFERQIQEYSKAFTQKTLA